MFKALYSWMGSRVYTPYATPILAVLFYLEAMVFIIPTDPMLIVYCIERQSRAFWYATVAMVSSVLGGVTGYIIGYLLWHYAGQAIIHNAWLNMIIKPDDFYYLCNLYQKHEYIAILIAGFTPIPYKAATFTAGFCHLSLMPFILCSLLARGARFYLYAIAISLWGKQIKEYIDRYFALIVVSIPVLIALFIWLCKH